MTQSVELTFEDDLDEAVRAEWARLAAAGLPTEQRSVPSPSHRPHLTLWASERLAADADARLPVLLDGLALPLRLEGLAAFGPRRGRLVVVRQVVPSLELLRLQETVAQVCVDGEAPSLFAAGGWVPHVTLAHRVPVADLGAVAAALGPLPVLDTTVRVCRRWDSERRESWSLVGG